MAGYLTSLQKLPFEAYRGDAASVFVSFAHRDQEHVFKDLAHLNDHGLRLWYDEGIRLGAPWRDEIASAIDRASVMLLYVSGSSIGSVACVQEINYALDCHKPVLTVFLTNHPLSPGLELSLGSVQGIERFRMDYDDFCTGIVGGIGALMAGPQAVRNPDVAAQIIHG